MITVKCDKCGFSKEYKAKNDINIGHIYQKFDQTEFISVYRNYNPATTNGKSKTLIDHMLICLKCYRKLQKLENKAALDFLKKDL